MMRLVSRKRCLAVLLGVSEFVTASEGSRLLQASGISQGDDTDESVTNPGTGESRVNVFGIIMGVFGAVLATGMLYLFYMTRPLNESRGGTGNTKLTSFASMNRKGSSFIHFEDPVHPHIGNHGQGFEPPSTPPPLPPPFPPQSASSHAKPHGRRTETYETDKNGETRRERQEAPRFGNSPVPPPSWVELGQPAPTRAQKVSNAPVPVENKPAMASNPLFSGPPDALNSNPLEGRPKGFLNPPHFAAKRLSQII